MGIYRVNPSVQQKDIKTDIGIQQDNQILPLTKSNTTKKTEPKMEPGSIFTTQKSGGDTGIRTPDPLLAKQVL